MFLMGWGLSWWLHISLEKIWMLLSIPMLIVLNALRIFQLRRLYKRIDHDPETGLGSSRWFEQRLEQECALLGREGIPLALVVVSVAVHPEHDEARVLAAVGEHVHNTLRQGEQVSRVGPCHLALLARNCSAQQAGSLQQRIEQHLQGLRVLGSDGVLQDFSCTLHVLTQDQPHNAHLFFRNGLRALTQLATDH